MKKITFAPSLVATLNAFESATGAIHSIHTAKADTAKHSTAHVYLESLNWIVKNPDHSKVAMRLIEGASIDSPEIKAALSTTKCKVTLRIADLATKSQSKADDNKKYKKILNTFFSLLTGKKTVEDVAGIGKAPKASKPALSLFDRVKNAIANDAFSVEERAELRALLSNVTSEAPTATVKGKGKAKGKALATA